MEAKHCTGSTPYVNAFCSLEDDKTRPRKQRHTAKRILERLRDEHGFMGGYTIVKDYVRERRLRTQEMFVPLVHSPGHALKLNSSLVDLITW